MPVSGSPIYSLMLIAGIGLSAACWWRLSKSDSRLPLVYFGGLLGAFLGAKLAFLLAEGWLYFDAPDRWLRWLSGKSIIGALPGGWAGVELAKKLSGYPAITGDRFALIIPIPLMLGRIGCLSAGCCLGIQMGERRWPAVPVEITFQLSALLLLLICRWQKWLSGQLFFAYLIAYGLFRFGHEFLRETPKTIFGFSGYQLIALATALAAAIAFRSRSLARG